MLLTENKDKASAAAVSSRRLAGKSGIVTGSTRGIGLGIAEGLAAAGMNVTLNGRGRSDEMEALRAELEARHDVKVLYADADMTKPAEIDRMVANSRDYFGAVDVLVYPGTL